MKRIGIIGAGNLGISIAQGLVRSGEFAPSDFLLSRRNTSKLQPLKEAGYPITEDNKEVVTQSEVVLLAVLPQKLNEVLDDIKDVIGEQLLVSLVSGATIEQIRARIGSSGRIVRAMPNTAISLGESMTCIAGDDPEDRDRVKAIFDHVGESVVINEEQMTSATALCACGIAFFLRAVRAASQGGIEIDFHAGESLKMAAQTAKGAAMLLLEHGTHPEDEIDKVTSPKGCTIAGLNQMEHSGFSSAFIKGITTSASMAGELYQDKE